MKRLIQKDNIDLFIEKTKWFDFDSNIVGWMSVCYENQSFHLLHHLFVKDKGIEKLDGGTILKYIDFLHNYGFNPYPYDISKQTVYKILNALMKIHKREHYVYSHIKAVRKYYNGHALEYYIRKGFHFSIFRTSFQHSNGIKNNFIYVKNVIHTLPPSIAVDMLDNDIIYKRVLGYSDEIVHSAHSIALKSGKRDLFIKLMNKCPVSFDRFDNKTKMFLEDIKFIISKTTDSNVDSKCLSNLIGYILRDHPEQINIVLEFIETYKNAFVSEDSFKRINLFKELACVGKDNIQIYRKIHDIYKEANISFNVNANIDTILYRQFILQNMEFVKEYCRLFPIGFPYVEWWVDDIDARKKIFENPEKFIQNLEELFKLISLNDSVQEIAHLGIYSYLFTFDYEPDDFCISAIPNFLEHLEKYHDKNKITFSMENKWYMPEHLAILDIIIPRIRIDNVDDDEIKRYICNIKLEFYEIFKEQFKEKYNELSNGTITINRRSDYTNIRVLQNLRRDGFKIDIQGTLYDFLGHRSKKEEALFYLEFKQDVRYRDISELFYNEIMLKELKPHIEKLTQEEIKKLIVSSDSNSRQNVVNFLIDIGISVPKSVLRKYGIRVYSDEDVDGDKYICVICYQNAPKVVYRSCGHCFVCVECSKKITNECPVDRIPITGCTILKGENLYNCMKCKKREIEFVQENCEHALCKQCKFRTKCSICNKKGENKRLYRPN